ncbi:vasopressin V1a receptor-like [Haliotis asinina]|uniref:vasopressin V1a receptor-like n=1 Tax=Haliotis asinina TaxID=109174 RepID=UPI0035318777
MDLEYFNSSDNTYDYHFDTMAETNPFTALIVVNSVLLCVGVCANIWMIRSLYKSWKTGNRMHFYLLAICLADVLGLCIRSGVDIGLYATVVWRGGYYGCKIFLGLLMFGVTMSHLILAGFNIDNLFTITCSRSIKALRFVFLLLSFLTAFMTSVVKFYFYRLVTVGYSNKAHVCVVEGFGLLPVVDTAVYFLLPLLMMLLFGLPSLFVWCCRKGTLSFEEMTSDDDPSTDLQFIVRDVGIALAYDVVFLLCCAPVLVFWISGSMNTKIGITTFTTLTSLDAANPCLNPIIYAIFSCIGRRRHRTSPGL